MSDFPPPPLLQSPPGPRVVVDGEPFLYFGGTSYLGLHAHPQVIAAGIEALRTHGVHSATTRAGFGTTQPLLDVESAAAEFFGTEAAFYFTSGYAANHVLVQTLASEIGAVFVESAAHFSIQEAARIPGLPVRPFASRDPAHLRRMLKAHTPPRGLPLVMTDAVAPATGALAPLLEYREVLTDFAPAILLVDDAHGFGVLGTDGRGTFDHLGLWPRVNSAAAGPGVRLVAGGTLGKALGGFGGILPGSARFIAAVRAHSHYFEGASAPASAIAGSSACALRLARAHPEWRSALRARAAQLRAGLHALGIEVPDSPAAHFGVALGDSATMQKLHLDLRRHGILVPHLASYSGLGPGGVLRFAVFADHTPDMIDELLSVLKLLL